MPKSKRAKVVHLTQTSKKDKESKRLLYTRIQESVKKYAYLFVFAVDNMRNTHLKDVRNQFSDSRLFFGKTKVMAKALGTTPETSHAQNLHLLSSYLTGAVGLLFTPHAPDSILTYFASYAPLDYARAGTVSPCTFSIPSGTIYSRAGEMPVEEDEAISHTLEPQLRKLGVPTRLVKGKVQLETEDPYVVCSEGETLDSRQTTLLKMFGVAVSEFRVEMRAWWNKETGEVKEVRERESMDVDGE